MRLVVDANVLFSAVIKDSYARHLLINGGFTLYVPEFVFQELNEHNLFLAEKTLLSQEQINEIIDAIFVAGNIRSISLEEYTDCMDMARSISPDVDDVPYLALAIKLQCPLWSNDKKLKKQDRIIIVSTEEIIRQSREL